MSDSKIPEEMQMQKHIQEMRDWLNNQPHLPQDVDDIILQRFVHSCYYDLERAKKAANLFFTIRGSSPDLLNNCRDPQSPQMKIALSIVNLAQLKISGNRNLWIWQLNDPGLDNYDYVQDARMFLLSTDSWLLEDTQMEEADLVLMDVKDISLKFLTKFNISVAKRIARYQEDAMPIRLKEIHVVNAPSFIDKLYGLMKPLLKQDVTDMMRFHPPKSETLFNHFTKEELPEDFGGTNGRMEDHMKGVLQSILEKRDKLMEPNLWQAADTKKSKNKKDNIEPDSFRSLNID